MKKISSLLFLLTLLTNWSNAQPFTLDKKIKPTELTLLKFEPKGKPKGKLNISKIKQLTDTAYFFCKGLSIYSPASIIVHAQDSSSPLIISLNKDNWNVNDRSGSTNSSGIWSESFKTEGSFGIRIITRKLNVKYNIYVWVGNELKITLPSAFKQTKK